MSDYYTDPGLTRSERIAKHVRRTLGKMENKRTPWENDWQEIAQLTLPRRELFEFSENSAENVRVGINVFDGTAISASNLLANGLQGNLVSQAITWFRLVFEQKVLNELPGAKEWLEAVSEHLYSVFRTSNFYDSMHEMLLDGITIGTATMFTQEDLAEGSISYATIHPGDVFIENDYRGRVDKVYRRWKWTIRQVVQAFGEDISDRITYWMTHDPFKEVTLVHAIEPRSDFDDLMEEEGADNQRMPWASFVVILDSALGPEDDNLVLQDSGFEQNPYMVWRYRKNSGETYGRSPSSDAISEIKRSNQFSRSTLVAAEKSVDPPINVPEEMRNRVRTGPGGRNVYEDAGRVITPVFTGLNYPVGVDREERLQEIIEKFYHINNFLILSNVEREMTATESVGRQNESATLLGPMVGRLNHELLEPLIERTFWLELISGRLPPPPPILQSIPDAKLTIDFIGPLAQQQKRAHSSQGTLQTLQATAPWFQIWPQMADNFNPDGIAQNLGDSFGAPSEIIFSPEQVKKIRAIRAEEQRRQQQLAAVEQMGGVKQLNEPVVAGSPLEGMAEAVEGAQ